VGKPKIVQAATALVSTTEPSTTSSTDATVDESSDAIVDASAGES
jgi:hypothetical protein